MPKSNKVRRLPRYPSRPEPAEVVCERCEHREKQQTQQRDFPGCLASVHCRIANYSRSCSKKSASVLAISMLLTWSLCQLPAKRAGPPRASDFWFRAAHQNSLRPFQFRKAILLHRKWEYLRFKAKTAYTGQPGTFSLTKPRTDVHRFKPGPSS